MEAISKEMDKTSKVKIINHIYETARTNENDKLT